MKNFTRVLCRFLQLRIVGPVSFLLLCIAFADKANAQISLTASNPTYTQDFDNYDGYNSSTIGTGWSISCPNFRGRGNGSSNTGGAWAYGSGSDWSAGYLGSGTSSYVTYNVSFVNNTGSTITSLVISYDYKQWRFACGNSNGWTVTGSGALTASLSGLNTNSTCPGTNGVAAVTPKSVTLTGLNIAAGATFGINWACSDGAGNDNANAFDNFSLTAVTSNTCSAVTAGTISSSNGATFCGSGSTTLTLSGTTPATGVQYQWRQSADNVNWTNTGTNTTTYATGTINATTYYKCVVSCASGTGKDSATYRVNVTPPPTPTATISSNAPAPLCLGTTVTFTATGTDTGTAPTYTWKDGATIIGTGRTISYIPAIGSTITCVLTSNATCVATNTVTSNTLNMAVLPIVAPTAVISSNAPSALCAGTPVTFTVNGTDTGAAPTYTWKDGTTTIGTGRNINYTPVNGAVITCVLTSNAACISPATVTSNALTMQVIPLVTPSVTISSNAPATLCAGTPVTFTATPVNGGSTPVCQWKSGATVIGSGASVVYTPVDGSSITCTMTSNATCASPATVTSVAMIMDVAPLMVPSIAISSNAPSPLCVNTQVTFTCDITNGGTTPAYTWKSGSNVIGTGNAINYTPVNGEIITCELHSNIACATPALVVSAPLTMNVSPFVTPSVSITSNATTPMCAGTPVQFNATAVYPGSLPYFVWKRGVDVIGTGSTFTFVPENGDIVTCTLSSDIVCATVHVVTSNALTMNITPRVAPSVTVLNNAPAPLCAGTSVQYTAAPLNGGSAPVYIWKSGVTPIGTGAALNYTPVSGESITCEMTSNATCITTAQAISHPVSLPVQALPVVSVTPAGSLTFCQNQPLFIRASGGSSYQWYYQNAPLPGYTTPEITPVTSGSYKVIATAGGCSSAMTDGVDVTIRPLPVLHVTANGPVMTVANTYDSYQWYLNGTAIPGATAYTYTGLQNGLYTVSAMNSYGCDDTSAAFVLAGLGVPVFAAQAVKVYPNPANSFVMVEAPEKVNVQVAGIDGKVLIRSEDAQRIDISGLANGIYLLTITDMNGHVIAAERLTKW